MEPNKTQRRNLLKLADYLESLPRDYEHFDMFEFAEHHGICNIAIGLAAISPKEFLANCGTVACAVGHGPAAGIRLQRGELRGKIYPPSWNDYSTRVFGCSVYSKEKLFDFMFGAEWRHYDNSHYGAAARIRYYLTTGDYSWPSEGARAKYAPYRKGSRSKARREALKVAA